MLYFMPHLSPAQPISGDSVRYILIPLSVFTIHFNHYDSTVYPKTTLARAFPFALPVVVTHSPIHQAFCSASYK